MCYVVNTVAFAEFCQGSRYDNSTRFEIIRVVRKCSSIELSEIAPGTSNEVFDLAPSGPVGKWLCFWPVEEFRGSFASRGVRFIRFSTKNSLFSAR